MTEYILTIGLIHQLTHIFSDNMAGNSNFKALHLLNAYELNICNVILFGKKCKYLKNLTKTIFLKYEASLHFHYINYLSVN